MDVNQGFYWKKESDSEHGLEFIILGWAGSQEKPALEAWVIPGHGSNLCRFSAGGQALIDFDAEVLLSPDFSGTPILYPTPNRVRDCVFHYRGKEYPQSKRGAAVYEHGLVHDEPWNALEPVSGENSISLRTWIDFQPGSPLFAAFPFKHRLALVFCLNPEGVKVTYSIENQDVVDIPFGFGLHPYFTRLEGDDVRLELPARFVMETTPDLLPTGRLLDVGGTIYDLREETLVDAVDFDHVFTGIEAGKFARVRYPSRRLQVQMRTSPDFTHLVLYSPRGMGFFCLENQTCSTDAHNLYARGFAAESGLKLAPAGKVHTGSVYYRVTREI